MKKALTILTGILLTVSSLHGQLPLSVQQRLQDTLNYMRSHYDYVGLSACASVKGEGLWKGTAGISEPGVPLNTDMLIGIGSNTKTFVSAMMLKLEEDGLVNINDTIGTWIQGYDNIAGDITIKQILDHTSGLFDYTQNPVLNDSLVPNLSRVWTKEELLHDFVEAPNFSPGTDWGYSNTNYIIAGIIEEQVTGRPVDKLLRDSIFIPLHLDHTFFPPQQTPPYPLSKFWYNGNYPDYNYPIETYSIAASAGGIVSNPEDVVHFWEALFNGDIIKQSTLHHEMLHLYSSTVDGSSGYGLGIFKDTYIIDGAEHPVYDHGGTWLGQINDNLVDTLHGITIDVLSNEDSLINDHVVEVVKALYAILLEETTAVHEVSNNKSLVCYPNPANDILYIRNQEGNLKTLQLFDLSGKKVLEHYVVPGKARIQLNVRNVEPGTYILKGQTDNGAEENLKVMIVR